MTGSLQSAGFNSFISREPSPALVWTKHRLSIYLLCLLNKSGWQLAEQRESCVVLVSPCGTTRVVGISHVFIWSCQRGETLHKNNNRVQNILHPKSAGKQGEMKTSDARPKNKTSINTQTSLTEGASRIIFFFPQRIDM